MISSSTEVKEIQDRNASARARVMNATMSLGIMVDRKLIAAAMMELAAVWRDEADWWDATTKKGRVATAKELRMAATRVAGFAVGLTTGPLTGDEPVGTAVTVGGIEFVKHGVDPFPETTGDPVMDFLTGATDSYEPVAPPAATVTQLVDNPFVSPASPGAGRPKPATVPYVGLSGLAEHLASASPRDHVSHSYVSSYESCSLSALLSDATKAGAIGVRRPSWSLIGGSAFHAAVESVERGVHSHQAIVDPQGLWAASLDVEVKNAMAAVSDTVYADMSTWHVANGGREGYDWWRVEGEAMLLRYLLHHNEAWREDRCLLEISGELVIEYPYSMTVRGLDGASGITTEGFIDAAWVDMTSGQITIVDYKSGRSAPTGTFQLGEYAHALVMAQPLIAASTAPLLGSYWLARKGEYSTPIDVLSAHPLVELQYRYDAAWRGTQARIFTPSQSNLCASCSVRDYCPTQERSGR